MAMAMAVEALRKGYVRRIILTRPALEAGESLGYLPGTLYEKSFLICVRFMTPFTI